MSSVTIAVRRPLLVLFFVLIFAGPLVADQGVPRAAPASQAAAPSPKASPLFKPAGTETGTIAEAQKADTAANSSGATVSMSNTALILIIVILVILLVT